MDHILYVLLYNVQVKKVLTNYIHRSEIDLSPKRSECERSNANWDRYKIDVNDCEHFLKANWDRSQTDPTWIDLNVNGP